MPTKELKKKKEQIKNNRLNWFSRQKTKPLYVLFYPLSMLIYYGMFFWLITKIPYVRKSIAPIWKTINSVVLTSPATLFMSFILPIVFIFILTNILHASTALAGIVAQIPVLVLVISMPIVFVDFKRSSILKRLFVSNVNQTSIIVAFVTYFMFISLLSILITFGITIAIFQNKETSLFFEYKRLSLQLKYTNWGGLFLGMILNLFFAGGIGIIISSYAKTPMFALAIGMVILIPGGFLTGQYFSLGFIIRNNYMKYLSYLFWQKYPTLLIINSLDVNGTFGSLNPELLHQNPLFDSESWKVMSGFSTNDILLEKMGLSSSDLSDIIKVKNVINGLNINNFIGPEEIMASNQTLIYLSIGVSVAVPIPLYILGIKYFKWSTR